MKVIGLIIAVIIFAFAYGALGLENYIAILGMIFAWDIIQTMKI